ncbi:nucleotidyltransferase domain-containing protein [Candidatus Margulisiibacteriota bacterium]
MRLKDREVTAIKNIILSRDREAKIYLFGSRTDDDKKGGDIDLLIISDKITAPDKRKIKLNLYDQIGEQKIDLLLEKDLSKSFVKVAINEGVLL